MTLKKSEKANDMRQLLGVSISETQMIEKRLSCCTLISLIGKYFDKLVSPGFQDAVINDLVVCFFQKRQRAEEFVGVLTRIVWDYNFVNKMFV